MGSPVNARFSAYAFLDADNFLCGHHIGIGRRVLGTLEEEERNNHLKWGAVAIRTDQSDDDGWLSEQSHVRAIRTQVQRAERGGGCECELVIC